MSKLVTRPRESSPAECVEEYHRLMLLASNFVEPGMQRPMHIINGSARLLTGPLAGLFETLDDDTRAFLPNARTVGASQSRACEESGCSGQDLSARVVVI